MRIRTGIRITTKPPKPPGTAHTYSTSGTRRAWIPILFFIGLLSSTNVAFTEAQVYASLDLKSMIDSVKYAITVQNLPFLVINGESTTSLTSNNTYKVILQTTNGTLYPAPGTLAKDQVNATLQQLFEAFNNSLSERTFTLTDTGIVNFLCHARDDASSFYFGRLSEPDLNQSLQYVRRSLLLLENYRPQLAARLAQLQSPSLDPRRKRQAPNFQTQPPYNPYNPQQPSQPPYNPYNPQQPMQPPYNPQQPQQPYNPQNPQPPYDPYNPQQPNPYNPYGPQSPNVPPQNNSQNPQQPANPQNPYSPQPQNPSTSPPNRSTPPPNQQDPNQPNKTSGGIPSLPHDKNGQPQCPAGCVPGTYHDPFAAPPRRMKRAIIFSLIGRVLRVFRGILDMLIGTPSSGTPDVSQILPEILNLLHDLKASIQGSATPPGSYPPYGAGAPPSSYPYNPQPTPQYPPQQPQYPQAPYGYGQGRPPLQQSSSGRYTNVNDDVEVFDDIEDRKSDNQYLLGYGPFSVCRVENGPSYAGWSPVFSYYTLTIKINDGATN